MSPRRQHSRPDLLIERRGYEETGVRFAPCRPISATAQSIRRRATPRLRRAGLKTSEDEFRWLEKAAAALPYPLSFNRRFPPLCERVRAGIERAKAEGVALGRPSIEDSNAGKFEAIKVALAAKKAFGGLQV